MSAPTAQRGALSSSQCMYTGTAASAGWSSAGTVHVHRNSRAGWSRVDASVQVCLRRRCQAAGSSGSRWQCSRLTNTNLTLTRLGRAAPGSDKAQPRVCSDFKLQQCSKRTLQPPAPSRKKAPERERVRSRYPMVGVRQTLPKTQRCAIGNPLLGLNTPCVL